MSKEKKLYCSICGKEIKGYGNNPYPLCDEDDYESRCCDDCDNLVIQARIMLQFNQLDHDTLMNIRKHIKNQRLLRGM